jgi:hypothetical protein
MFASDTADVNVNLPVQTLFRNIQYHEVKGRKKREWLQKNRLQIERVGTVMGDFMLLTSIMNIYNMYSSGASCVCMYETVGSPFIQVTLKERMCVSHKFDGTQFVK